MLAPAKRERERESADLAVCKACEQGSAGSCRLERADLAMCKACKAYEQDNAGSCRQRES